jgi:hypothetical protein
MNAFVVTDVTEANCVEYVVETNAPKYRFVQRPH